MVVDLERMSPRERRDYYDAKVGWIVEHAWSAAPAVRAKLEQAGLTPADVRSVADLARVPITSKDDLVRLQKESPPFGGFTAARPGDLRIICMSPGPTYNSPGADESYLRRVESAFRACGLRPGDVLVNTFSYHVSPMGLLLDTPLKRFGATVIPMGGGNKTLQVQVMRDLGVTVFTGTATFLLEILQTAEEMGIDPRKDLALRLAVTPLDHGVMKIVERDYGIRITEFYGTADVGIVAYNCEERFGMHVSEDAILEICELNGTGTLGPGQVGRVVLTPLDATFPYLRYAPGDLSSWNQEPCRCGRTSIRLDPLAGWIGQAVKVRGMFVHPAQLGAVMAVHPGISAYQLVCRTVDDKDHIALRYAAAVGGLEERLEGSLEERLALRFVDLCRLNLDSIERVEPDRLAADGKVIVDERPQGAK